MYVSVMEPNLADALRDQSNEYKVGEQAADPVETTPPPTADHCNRSGGCGEDESGDEICPRPVP